MRKLIFAVLGCAFLLSMTIQSANAELVVIVGKNSQVNVLHSSQIRRLFLGKKKYYPSGERAHPIDLPQGSAVREQFYKKIFGKNEAQLKAYWSKMVFSGKANPPEILDDAETIKEEVSDSLTALAYIDAKDLDDSVKVVFRK